MPLYDDIQRLKWVVWQRGIYNPTTVPFIFPLSQQINSGPKNQERVGDKVIVKKILFRYSLTYGDSNNIVRVMVFYQKGRPIPGVSLSDFMDNGPSGSPDVFSMTYPYLHGQSYELLYDKTHVLVQGAQNATITNVAEIDCSHSLDYLADLNVSANGEFYLVWLSDSGLTPNPQLNSNWVVWYHDVGTF